MFVIMRDRSTVPHSRSDIGSPMSVAVKGRMIMKRCSWVLLVIAALASLSACAEKGPVLLEGVMYKAPEGMQTGASKVTVGVSVFKDERGKITSVLGKRTIRDSVENDLVVQGTVADLVAASMKEALKARGIAVRDLPAGDIGELAGKTEGTDIVIGGEIKTLWVDVSSQPLNVKMNAEVQLRVSAADKAEKKVFRTLVLNSKVERQDIAFSFDAAAGALSEALSAAIDQLMKDDEFKKKIH